MLKKLKWVLRSNFSLFLKRFEVAQSWFVKNQMVAAHLRDRFVENMSTMRRLESLPEPRLHIAPHMPDGPSLPLPDAHEAAPCAEKTSRCAHTHTLRAPDVITHLAQGLDDMVVSLGNHSIFGHVFVPSTPFPPIFSSRATSLTTPAASPTLSTGIRPTPCATPLEAGLPGRLARPIPNIGYEAKFCIDVDGDHTPVNLPSRNVRFPQEYDAKITASEDLNLPRHSGALSRASIRQQAGFPLCRNKVH